jgi:hypothetical protein
MRNLDLNTGESLVCRFHAQTSDPPHSIGGCKAFRNCLAVVVKGKMSGRAGIRTRVFQAATCHTTNLVIPDVLFLIS